MNPIKEIEFEIKKRITLSVNDKFLKQLKYLADKIFHTNHSYTLTKIIEHICGDEDVLLDFRKYYTENAKSIEMRNIHQSGIIKNYNIGKKAIKSVNKAGKGTVRSAFMRGMVSYMYNKKSELISKDLDADIVKKIEQATGLKVLNAKYVDGRIQLEMTKPD